MKLKERFKSVLAAVATAALALTLVPSSALAESVEFTPDTTGGTITIKQVANGDTAKLYRVADITVNKDTNVATFTAVDGFAVESVNGYVAKHDSGAATVIAADAADAQAVATTTADNNQVIFNKDLKPGIYYVQITGTEGTSYTYQPIVVALNLTNLNADGVQDGNWYYNATADSSNPSIEAKKLSNAVLKTVKVKDSKKYADYGESVSAMPGDTLEFKIDFTVDRGSKNYTLTDTMSNGLGKELKNVKIADASGKVVTDQFTISVVDGNGVFTVTAKDAANAAGSYTLTYSVTVSNDAVLAGDTNKVEVGEFTDTVSVKYFNVEVTKVNDKKETLNGAEFELYRDVDGDGKLSEKDGDALATLTTTDGGKFTTQLLSNETNYILHETKAPAGYKLAADTLIDSNSKGIVFGSTLELPITDPTDNTVINLPSTGGAGTVGLTVVGVALMIGAGAWVVRSRKEN